VNAVNSFLGVGALRDTLMQLLYRQIMFTGELARGATEPWQKDPEMRALRDPIADVLKRATDLFDAQVQRANERNRRIEEARG
jgi:hypothetical protein